MSGHQTNCASINERIVIERPVEDVFAFYRDFRNLPQFLGDVMRIELTGDRTSRWTIRGPLGLEVHWTVLVTEIRENALIAYETQSAVARAGWEVSFLQGPRADTTVLRELMSMSGGWITRFALAAVGKPPAREVHADLRRLKERLETGHVTTLDHAVAGKFAI